MAQQPPTTHEEAEAMTTVVTAADIQITNPGVVEMPAHGRTRPTVHHPASEAGVAGTGTRTTTTAVR
ncbi:hypothetical protein [Streptomyces sp. NPDC000931]|uniref:hypothetical protein n=1 Tax=Streptomyces sp. NPDC000931 TaxID=3154372 RepID=UPI00331AD180